MGDRFRRQGTSYPHIQVSLIDSLDHSWPPTSSLTAGGSLCAHTRADLSCAFRRRLIPKADCLGEAPPALLVCGWLLANEYGFDIFTR